MKVIIFGSRSFADYDLLKSIIASTDFYRDEKITEVISGGAKGVDSLGARWARENNIPVTLMEADWEYYGRAAGPIRNKEMASIGDAGIGIWDGKSRGTLNMITLCKKMKLPCYVYRTDQRSFIDI